MTSWREPGGERRSDEICDAGNPDRIVQAGHEGDASDDRALARTTVAEHPAGDQ